MNMRTLLTGCGPVAHLALDRNDLSPLTGEDMANSDLLVSPGLDLLIEDGIISRMLPSGELLQEMDIEIVQTDNQDPSIVSNPNAEFTIWDMAGRAIIPGLVDAHTHLLWSGDRSRELGWRQGGLDYRTIGERGGGIGFTVGQTRSTPQSNLLSSGVTRAKTALSAGTTFMEVKSGYGLDTPTELKLLEIASKLASEQDLPDMHLTWLGAHSTPPDESGGLKTVSERRRDYVEDIISQQLPAVVEQGLAQSADVFCEPGWFTVDETESISQASLDAGLSLRLHVDEFVDGGGMGLAADLGASTADHAHYSSDENREKANEAGVLQGFLPGTPYTLGDDHWPPLSEAVEREWAFSLATDFNPNCHLLSLPFVGSIASQRLGLDPLTSLVAVSRNPASALSSRHAQPRGVLVEGGPADLNVLWGEHWEGWCQTPGHSPFSMTMMGGEWYSQGEPFE